MLRALLLILALIATPVSASAARRAYATQGDCGGRPMTTVRMAPGYCLGLVWQGDGADGPRMPRGLLALSGGDWLVTDLGGWQAGRGSVWRLSFAPDGSPRWRRLAQGLSMPHTVARGPDGRIYVSEMNRILTLDPDAADPAATVRTVIGDLPDNRLHDNRHPLSSFVFDGDGALLVNVGAPQRPLRGRQGPAAHDGLGRLRRQRRDGPGAASRLSGKRPMG